jgi:hypothetical protein
MARSYKLLLLRAAGKRYTTTELEETEAPMVVHVDPNHTLLYFAHRDDISPSDDVDWWGAEGVDQVIEEGGPRDWMKLARAIAADPHGLPGQYLRKCSSISRERAEVAGALRRILQSAIDEEDDPLRHVPPWWRSRPRRSWLADRWAVRPRIYGDSGGTYWSAWQNISSMSMSRHWRWLVQNWGRPRSRTR